METQAHEQAETVEPGVGVGREVSEIAAELAKAERQFRRLAAEYVGLVTPIAQVEKKMKALRATLDALQSEAQSR